MVNLPFGKKSIQTFTNEEGEQERGNLTYNCRDFWATTSNKQMNFVQHIRSILKHTGNIAMVIPGKVLFEGGAVEVVRKKLVELTDVHTGQSEPLHESLLRTKVFHSKRRRQKRRLNDN